LVQALAASLRLPVILVVFVIGHEDCKGLCLAGARVMGAFGSLDGLGGFGDGANLEQSALL
jgi:hypothetical protein